MHPLFLIEFSQNGGNMEIRLSELSEKIGANTPDGSGDIIIKGVAPVETATKNDITFITGDKFLKKLENCNAAAVILPEKLTPPENIVPLYVDEPYYFFIKVLELFDPGSGREISPGISPHSFINESAVIGKNVSIAPFVLIGEKVIVGDNTTIGAGTVILKNSSIGTGCLVYPNVSIMDRTSIGNDVIIHGGAVIGGDGFGFYPHKKSLVKIPQIGKVEIGNNVEIGANTCIDRAVMGVTKIDDGVKLDNLVQIGHNVKVGSWTVMASMTGVSGSTEIGKGVKIGGQAGFGEHLKVGDGAGVAGQAGVTKDVPPGTIVSGYPAKEHMKAIREEIHIRNLPNLKDKVKELEKRISELENKE